MNSSELKRFIIVACLTVCFFPISTIAQIEPTLPKVEQTLSVEFRPLYPKPDEDVTIYLSSSFFETDLARFTWLIDGKFTKQGVGEKSLKFRMKSLGETTEVTVTITPPTGGSAFTRTYRFVSSNVDLMWQARTYTPPFYEGKSLLIDSASYVVTAIPQFADTNGNFIPKEQLHYTWRKNENLLGQQSGIGKHTINVDGSDIRRGETVEVTVSTQDKSAVVKKEIVLGLTTPFVNLYELHPLYGIAGQKELSTQGSLSLANRELTLAAEPFFFSIKKGMIIPYIEYVWKVNGKNIESDKTSNAITLRNEGGKGSTIIETLATDPSSLLQRAKQRIEVNFGE
jgi:hypothetical protein